LVFAKYIRQSAHPLYPLKRFFEQSSHVTVLTSRIRGTYWRFLLYIKFTKNKPIDSSERFLQKDLNVTKIASLHITSHNYDIYHGLKLRKRYYL